jgi:isopentenyl-diphosphate delta-isomerase
MVDEQLILVDECNRAVGTAGKDAIHRAWQLHRAFSIFMVDERGRLLLQQRNPRKYHSGGLWANSCCGHPRPGERTLSAARRRLNEELGVTGELSFGFFSRYRTDLDHGMQENEFVYVYFGALRMPTQPNPAEVSRVEFLSLSEIEQRIRSKPDSFAYWLRHYVRRHRTDIARHAKNASLSLEGR